MRGLLKVTLISTSVIIFLSSSSLALEKLVTILDDESVEDIPACYRSNVISCQKVEVNFQALRDEDMLEFPDGFVMSKKSQEAKDTGYATYLFRRNKFMYATLSVQSLSSHEKLMGKLHYAGYAMVDIRNCGESCHVLVKSVTFARSDAPDPPVDNPFEPISSSSSMNFTQTRMMASNRAKSNSKERSWLSLACYYSHEYAEEVGDPDFAIRSEIDDVNSIMRLNKLPIRFYPKCIAEAPLNESEIAPNRVYNIHSIQGTFYRLAKNADIVVSFYRDPSPSGLCGLPSAVDPVRVGTSLAIWVAHQCNEFQLAHELGHILGGTHNIEKDPTPGSNHGYWLKTGHLSTIMASYSDCHRQRIPYYSTTAFKFNRRRKIGNEEEANVRATLLMNYLYYEAYGDERGEGCEDVCMDFYHFNCYDQKDYCLSLYAMSFYCPHMCGFCMNCIPDSHRDLCTVIRARGLCGMYPANKLCVSTCVDHCGTR